MKIWKVRLAGIVVMLGLIGAAGSAASQEYSGEGEGDRISAGVNNEGSVGFHGISSALSPGVLSFRVALLGEAWGGTDVIRQNDEHRMLGGNVLINGAISDTLGFHVGFRSRNNVNTFGRPQTMRSQGNMNLGMTGRAEVSSGIGLGGELSVFLPSVMDGVGVKAEAMSLRPRLMASFDVDKITGRSSQDYVPVVFHANLGYYIDNSEALVGEGASLDRVDRFAYEVSAYDQVEVGLGVEFPFPYVTPVLGWNLGIPVSPTGDICSGDRALDCVREVGPAAYPHTLSLGAKAEPYTNLGLHVGLDIGLTAAQAEGLPMTPPYNFIFGMSWVIDPIASASAEGLPMTDLDEQPEEAERPIFGSLQGVVLNEDTGEPVGDARIIYIDREESGHLSREDSGRFRSYEFEVGEAIELAIEHPDYEAARVIWIVEEGVDELEIMMEPLPVAGVIVGQIKMSDMVDGEAVWVQIGDREGTVYDVSVDEGGYFEQEVMAGRWSVVARQDGFLSDGRDMEVGSGERVEIELLISEERGAGLVEVREQEIYVEERLAFEPGMASLREESLEVLDRVAAVLWENPQIRQVMIDGHSDDSGDSDYDREISRLRADSVRDYLVDRGVDPERLGTRGVGSAEPLVPNTSRRNRLLNRRIEFRLVE